LDEGGAYLFVERSVGPEPARLNGALTGANIAGRWAELRVRSPATVRARFARAHLGWRGENLRRRDPWDKRVKEPPTTDAR
jgi:hypothetical protein